MSKQKAKPANKQQLQEETKDPIRSVIAKPDDKIQQSDIHKFIEQLRHDDLEFDANYKAVKAKYHECYDSEIALHVKVGEARQQNELVKTSRAEVADKLHPVIQTLRQTVPDVSKHKMAMCLSNILRDAEGKKEAEAKGLSVSNITAILKIYVAKYGMIFDQTTEHKGKDHDDVSLRIYEIKVDDTDAIDELFRQYKEAQANGTFSYMNIKVNEKYNLEKFEIVTTGSE